MTSLSLSLSLALSLSLILPPDTPLTDRVLFLVDSSGSMHRGKLDRAIRGVMEIAAAPTDQLEIALYRFASDYSRWPGDGEGWAELPSATAVGDACAYAGAAGPSGGTCAIGPLVAALREPRDRLSIVLVSDGDFSDFPPVLLQILGEGQRWREENGFGRAVIAVWGIGPENTILRAIAKAGGGGYMADTGGD